MAVYVCVGRLSGPLRTPRTVASASEPDPTRTGPFLPVSLVLSPAWRRITTFASCARGASVGSHNMSDMDRALPGESWPTSRPDHSRFRRRGQPRVSTTVAAQTRNYLPTLENPGEIPRCYRRKWPVRQVFPGACQRCQGTQQTNASAL